MALIDEVSHRVRFSFFFSFFFTVFAATHCRAHVWANLVGSQIRGRHGRYRLGFASSKFKKFGFLKSRKIKLPLKYITKSYIFPRQSKPEVNFSKKKTNLNRKK